MTKKYNSPMLQIVSIKNNVIATSGEPELMNNPFTGTANDILAPDRFNSWNEGF